MKTAEQLAGLIMDADLPKRLMAENAKLRAALIECKHGAEYPDELGDIIDSALGCVAAPTSGFSPIAVTARWTVPTAGLTCTQSPTLPHSFRSEAK